MKVISFLARIGENVHVISLWLSLYINVQFLREILTLRFLIFALQFISLSCLQIYLCARAILNVRAR